MRLLLVLLAVLWFGGAAHAQTGRTEPVEDQIDVVQVDRRLLAVNARTGEVVEENLERGEKVLWIDHRGQIGVAATSVRLLGVSVRSANWMELRYRISEWAPDQYYLGERVVLVPLGTRVAAIGLKSGRWAERPIGPREWLAYAQADANLALALTERRAIAFPSEGSAFAEITINPGEPVEAISVEADSIVLTTNRRLLIFRIGAARWAELIRTGRR